MRDMCMESWMQYADQNDCMQNKKKCVPIKSIYSGRLGPSDRLSLHINTTNCFAIKIDFLSESKVFCIHSKLYVRLANIQNNYYVNH